MGTNIRTVAEPKFAQAAKDIGDVAKLKGAVENKFDEVKKALTNLLLPQFTEDLQEGKELVTNFKVPSGEAIQIDDDQWDVSLDGGTIQLVMKMPSTELDPAKLGEFVKEFGGHFAKLFERVDKVSEINDIPAFLAKAATDPKLVKNFKLGATGASIKVPDPSFYQGVPGVVIVTATVNRDAFLSKVNDLPADLRQGKAGNLLREFIEENLLPVIQVGNRTEAAASDPQA